MTQVSPSEEEILRLVAERESMRQARRFTESDAIREELRVMGVEIYDKEREWRSRDGRRGVLFTAGPVICSLTDDEIHQLISKREDARNSKDWSQADELRAELRRNGVELDDRAKTWRTANGRTGVFSGAAPQSAASLSEAEIRAFVTERERARAAQDFAYADELRRDLLRKGVELFDAERLWRANDGRQGVIVTGGTEIVQCTLDDGQIVSLVQARQDAKGQKDFERADAIRDELRRHGVELIDPEQMWRTTDGRTGPYTGAPQPLRPPAVAIRGSPGAVSSLAQGVVATSDANALLQDTVARLQKALASSQGAAAGSEAVATAAAQAQASLAAAQVHVQPVKGTVVNVAAAPVAARPLILKSAAAHATTLSDASILALISGREAALRESRDFQAADSIRHDLRLHGVEVRDQERTWRAADGRSGRIGQAPGLPPPAAPVVAPLLVSPESSNAGAVLSAPVGGAPGGAAAPISLDVAAVMALANRIK